MARHESPQTPLSKGVNDLIARLREDGVEAGRAEAATILEKARAEAAALREAAQRDAQAMRDQARRDADAYRQAGQEALETATRDSILDLKTQMTERFRADIRRLVSHQMTDTVFLSRMILELVGRVRDHIDADSAMEIILPAEAVDLEELRQNADDLENSPLTDFVRNVAGDLARRGVNLSVSEDVSAGARIYLENDDVMVDLSDVAVADMLSRHLQPRFRAILEGVVK